jgi:hypothetical protein
MATSDTGGGSAPNLKVISGALDQATPAPKVKRDKRAGGTDAWVQDQPELPILPDGCPIEPLGKLGVVHYFLDEARQLIALEPQRIVKGYIIAMMGRQAKRVHEFWPRYSDKTDKEGKPIVTGWKPEIAGELLMNACAQRGIFDPQGRVRGTGAHRCDDGELALHCGDKIYITGASARYQDPGLIAGYVYPAGPSRPKLYEDPQNTAAGEHVLMMLNAWNWQRPTIDPMLLLGHIGCCMLGGALDWRPHAWITGGSATGKSTLQKLLRAVQGGAALTTGNATEASIRQLLKQQTLPVFFDELEASADNRKASAVVELARIASSGDQVLKGGQNHEGAEFTVRSCFLFSSIKLPPMPTQDKNRLAVLELDPLSDLALEGRAPKAPTIDELELKELGRRIRRRLVDNWHHIGDLIDRYKTALGAQGHSGRSADQFGTLLAMADVMLYDQADVDHDAEKIILEWAHKLRADTLAEKVTEISDEEAVVAHLATSFLRGKGGEEPEPVVRAILSALQPDNSKSRERLENFGMRIVEKKINAKGEVGARSPSPSTPAKDLYLAIANNHVGLASIFDNTEWNAGTWSQSFGRVRHTIAAADGAPPILQKSERRVRVRFGPGVNTWSTLIPLPAILELNPVD